MASKFEFCLNFTKKTACLGIYFPHLARIFAKEILKMALYWNIIGHS